MPLGPALMPARADEESRGDLLAAGRPFTEEVRNVLAPRDVPREDERPCPRVSKRGVAVLPERGETVRSEEPLRPTD